MVFDEAMADAAERAIKEVKTDFDYQVREYPLEVVVEKHLEGQEDGENDLFIPDYQRDFVWEEDKQSRFIESLFMGLPIPYVFVADVKNENDQLSGRLEIIDGTQRIRTICAFVREDLTLSGLEKLSALNGMRFSNFSKSRQRRFNRTTIRMIELTEDANEEARRDMFERINTGSVTLNPMERRRGTNAGPFVDFTKKLATEPRFEALTPSSEANVKRFLRQELVSRFFALRYDLESYGKPPAGKIVARFVDDYTKKMNKIFVDEGANGAKEAELLRDWNQMLSFVERNFPYGFAKSRSATSTPRVRFESIAVGVAFALTVQGNLDTDGIAAWLRDPEFKRVTTSDAANNESRLRDRINFVKLRLLGA